MPLKSNLKALVALLLLVPFVAAAADNFQALSADAQKVVQKVTAGKPEDTAVCGKGTDALRDDVVSATKGLYFAGDLSGSPRTAGTAAGDYLKALCQH